MTEEQFIKVGMADLNVAAKNAVLKTSGLGSCVGVALYDPKTKVAGMAHIMLPSSEIAKEANFNRAKYADTAIPELIQRMNQLGAVLTRIVAKMAGGAQMFALNTTSDVMRIGPRNVESCKAQLHRLGVPIIAEDTGGSFGRTIELYSESGVLVLRTAQHGIKEL